MSRLNLRNKPRISYYEPDEPNLDEYVFCSHCGDFVYEFCSIHGPLLVIPDDKPPTISPFPPCVPRAALTIPHVFLHIAPSKIPGAGLGVFTTLALPSGVRFGPYEGKKTEQITSMYCWQITDYKNKRSHVIDAEDPNQSNWMRYVNCSRHWCEQNLIAYQYRGRLYYRTIKIIPRYTELMVFYGSDFARMLQINLKIYNAPTSYAQKFGAPLSKHLSSEENKPKEISLSTNCIKESKENNENNFIISNTQKNQVPKDVPKTLVKKNMQPAPNKVKFNVPKKTQRDNNKINTEISKNCIPKNTLDSKNPTLTLNLQPKEKNMTSSDLIPKNTDKNKDTVAKEKLKHISHSDHNNNTKNISKQKNEFDQPKNLYQNIFSCDICSFKTQLVKTLKSHLLTHRSETKYTCTYCDYITKYENRLIVHVRTHTGERPYACNYCEKKFSQRVHLILHSRTHTGERPYACNYCEKKFSQKGHLIVHTRTHTGEKPYACNYCEKKISDKSALIVHTRRTHTGEKPYACNYCEKKFSDKGSLILHTRTHTGEKPYACNYCEKKFSDKGYLIVHTRTHTGEKPYACNYCEKKFSDKSALIVHTRTHTGEKPYACNYCEKKFSDKSALIVHTRRTHTGEKPYACNYCEKKFSDKGSLILHTRTHTGERPYACNYCEKKFSQKGHLIVHTRTHTGEAI